MKLIKTINLSTFHSTCLRVLSTVFTNNFSYTSQLNFQYSEKLAASKSQLFYECLKFCDKKTFSALNKYLPVCIILLQL